MPTRRRLLRALAVPTVAVVTGCSGDGTGTPTPTVESTSLSFTSSAFQDGGSIPRRHTCDGVDVSAPLRIGSVPPAAESLALRVDDPDAPSQRPFVHWLVWNMPPDTAEIPAAIPRDPALQSVGGARQGTNGFGSVGYRGPCPPAGDGPHTYRWTLYALDTTLGLEPGARRDTFLSAIDGHRVGRTTTTGKYER